jgi:hypothetical protein
MAAKTTRKTTIKNKAAARAAHGGAAEKQCGRPAR